MKIIWVLENIEEKKDFYGKFNILLLLASVRLWKRHYPDDNCTLYCDSLTKDVLSTLKVLKLWDNIESYVHSHDIDRKVFWAASKLQVLSKQTEPCIILDNDTHIYKPIKEYLNPNKVYVHNLEVGKGYYPTGSDLYVRELSYRPRWKTTSVNVSFLQLPDPTFTQMYAKLSLDLMEQFTRMKVPNSQYLIFSEQLLLSHLLEKENIEYSSLLSNYWDCHAWDWGEQHDKGIWLYKDSGTILKHYGPLKAWYKGTPPEKTSHTFNSVKNNIEEFSYEKEVKHLVNCINLPNLDLTSINKR